MVQEKLEWKVHTANLLQEVLCNKTAWVLHRPLQIFGHILHEVAGRAIELDDPELNILMLRLSLYEQGDPEKPAFDPNAIDKQKARLEKQRGNKT